MVSKSMYAWVHSPPEFVNYSNLDGSVQKKLELKTYLILAWVTPAFRLPVW